MSLGYQSINPIIILIFILIFYCYILPNTTTQSCIIELRQILSFFLNFVEFFYIFFEHKKEFLITKNKFFKNFVVYNNKYLYSLVSFQKYLIIHYHAASRFFYMCVCAKQIWLHYRIKPLRKLLLRNSQTNLGVCSRTPPCSRFKMNQGQ